MNQDDVNRALELFGLSEPLTQETLEARRRALLATWHPHRYANLTNNPRKYMQMYKKGEAMSKEINAAYDLLRTWLAAKDAPASGSSGGPLTTPRG
jgi:DnaJ-domain-containing protein 1